MVRTYRKKPVTIKAIRFDGLNQEEVVHFHPNWRAAFFENNAIEIQTKEGSLVLRAGDYLVRQQGVFYTCGAEHFEKNYEEVREQDTADLTPEELELLNEGPYDH